MAARKPKRPRIQLRPSPARTLETPPETAPTDIESFIAAGRSDGFGAPGNRALPQIQGRASADTRPLNAAHVARLAVSIRALGLIEPIVVDAHDRLVAGGHRLAACSVLAAPPETRVDTLLAHCPDQRVSSTVARWLVEEAGPGELDPEQLPVRVVDFDSKADPERALALEAAENEQRRDYSPDEIRGLYRRLIKLGFTDRRGRPRRGERAARPVVAAVVGRSVRHLRRVLDRDEARKTGQMSGFESPKRHLRALERSVAALREHADHAEIAAILDLLPRDFEARVEAARIGLTTES